MELTDLRHFYNVATSKSFARGAELSHLSPPAISKAIKRLEASLDSDLLERTTRRVSLTDGGRALLAHCETLFAQIDEMQRDLHLADGRVRGEIRIAANEVFSTYLLPHALARLVRAHPDLTPRCYEMMPDQMAHWLRQGRLDVGFTIGADARSGVQVQPIASSPGVLVCGPGHPLFAVGRVDLSDLQTFPSVMPESFQREYLPALDQFPESIPRRVGCTVELLQMAVQLCLDGAYLGYFPEVSIRCHLRHGELRALDGLPAAPPFELCALTRPAGRPLASVRALIRQLAEAVAAAQSPTCA